MNRFWKHTVNVVASVTLAGCSTLQPVELSPEYSFRASESALWTELEAVQSGNWQVLLNNGPDALDWRLRAIDSATESIDLQTLLWSIDRVGALMLDHLAAAADRGVQVKILIDDYWLADEEKVFLELLEHKNVQYRVFNPFLRRSSNIVTRQVLNLAEFSRVDHRMHNKAMVVDNAVAFVGGRNLADEYFGLDERINFRDMELLVGGPIVGDVAAAFDSYWNNRWTIPLRSISRVAHSPADMSSALAKLEEVTHIHQEESYEVRIDQWRQLVASAFTGRSELIIDSPPGNNPALPENAPVQVTEELIRLIENASEEIVIISAYLIPITTLEQALKRANERGVKVRILTNSIRSNNHLAAHSAYRNHINTLIGYGAELHEVRADAKERQLYMVRPVDDKSLALHAKVLVVDSDKVFIGSANLDPRSLRINTEMGLLVHSEELATGLRSAVAPDFSLANAWRLQPDEEHGVVWVSDDQVLNSQPSQSLLMSIEDWFFAHLPLENTL